MLVAIFSAKILVNCTLWVCILEGLQCLPQNLGAKERQAQQGALEELEEQEVQEEQGVRVKVAKLVKEREEEHRPHSKAGIIFDAF